MSLSDDVNEGAEAKVEPYIPGSHVPEGSTDSDQMSEASASAIDSVVQSLSALRFVPTSVFRKQKQKSNASG